ncbi:MAG: glycoside hydrolase family 95-like protein [Bacillota bacterium]
MLLQSSNGEIHLLPALPEAWPTGKIEGVCARGGFEVNIYWEKGVLVKAKIRSKTATDSKVRYQQKTVKLNFEAGEEITLHSSDF